MNKIFSQKYEFINKDPIKKGAFGDIYRIRDKKVKTEYVLKKLRKEDPKNSNIIGTEEKSFEKIFHFLLKVLI